MIQWLRFLTSNPGGMGLIPGQGTKIPHVEWHVQIKKKGGFPGGSVVKISLPMQETGVQSLIWDDRSHMPYAVEQRSLYATTVEPGNHNYGSPRALEPVLHNERSHCSEKSAHCNW